MKLTPGSYKLEQDDYRERVARETRCCDSRDPPAVTPEEHAARIAAREAAAAEMVGPCYKGWPLTQRGVTKAALA